MPPMLQLLVVIVAIVMTIIAYDLAKKQGIDVRRILRKIALTIAEMFAVTGLCMGGLALMALIVLSFLYPLMTLFLPELRNGHWIARDVGCVCVVGVYLLYLHYKDRQKKRR